MPREVVDVAEGMVLCSMDDEQIYGPTVYTWTSVRAARAFGVLGAS
ncbi:hypothetical protein [Kitasatospora sp. HPMI-4]